MTLNGYRRELFPIYTRRCYKFFRLQGIMFSVTIVLWSLGVCCWAAQENVHSRFKRGACGKIYTKLDLGHTMCLQDAANGNTVPFSAAEKQTIVDQHNAFRAKAEAAGMMKLVWDDDVAIIAQKWASQCRSGHEPVSVLRATPKLTGITIGQNVANYYGSNYDYTSATNLWHDEIKDFVYGEGILEKSGHFTQVMREDAARVGCGRTRCTDGDITREFVVCNYATGQTQDQVKKPYEKCTSQSCKTACQTRDASGLCDCRGQLCLNGGTLNKQTCTCSCPGPFTGRSCETAECEGATDMSFCTNPAYCNYANIIPSCPLFCKVCPTNCDRKCQNGGTLNTAACLCTCPPDFTGDLCDISASGGVDPAPTREPKELGCSQECENKGIQDPKSCTCSCSADFTGELCETRQKNGLVRDCYMMKNRIKVYRGTLSKTNKGFTCQSWNTKSPNSHGFSSKYFEIMGEDFPDDIAAAENYCRDPAKSTSSGERRLWCYNGNGTSPRWDWCDDVAEC